MTRAGLVAQYKRLTDRRDHPRTFLSTATRKELSAQIADTLSQIRDMDKKGKAHA